MRLRAPLALLALLALLLAGGLTAAIAPANATEPDPLAGVPSVGSCFDMTFRQAYSEAMRNPVDCAQQHTLRVVGAHQLPARVAWSDSEGKIWRAVQRPCEQDWRRTTGADSVLLYRTLYSSWWFKPSPAEREAGARWYVCAIGLTGTAELEPLPTGPLPRPTKHNPDAIARCAARDRFVPCSAKHELRTVHTFKVFGTGDDDARAAAAGRAQARTCRRHVDGRRWAWSWRTVSLRWNVVACLERTRR